MKNNLFKIVVTAWNADKYIDKCIQSIITQSYSNWEMCILDDFSSDRTFDIAQRYSGYDNIQVRRTRERRTITENRIRCSDFLECSGNDVLIFVDGDDWLYHSNVFSLINDVYQNEGVRVTYGSFINTKNEKNIAKPLKKCNVVRNNEVSFFPLRTMKYFVFSSIPHEYLKSKRTNSYFSTVTDKAMMYSAVELAGYDHCVAINDILYVYNVDNSLNENKVVKKSIRNADRKEIMSFSPLSEIE